MTYCQYYDDEFRCDSGECYYSYHPERVAEIQTFIDMLGEERQYCDVCTGDYTKVCDCRWCGRVYAYFDDVNDYPEHVYDHWRTTEGDLADAFRELYGADVPGVGPVCWECLVDMGPEETVSDVRDDLDEKDRRALFDFDARDPEGAEDKPALADVVAYRRAYVAYRQRVCARVHEEDERWRADEKRRGRAAYKRVFAKSSPEDLERIIAGCKKARVDPTWQTAEAIAAELAAYIYDKV